LKQQQEFVKLAKVAENALIKVSARIVLVAKYDSATHAHVYYWDL